MKKLLSIIAGITLAFCMVSCSSPSERALKDSHELGVVSTQVQNKLEDLPFTASWLSSDYAHVREKYRKVYVCPVKTEALSDSLNITKEEDIKRLSDAAALFKGKLEGDIRKKAKGRMLVVNKPGKDVLNLQLHIVDMSRNNVAMNMLSFLIPLPASSQVAHVAFQGRVDMAGSIQEPEAGRLIAEFFDHNPGRYSIYSVKDYQKYGHARESAEMWREVLSDMFSEPKAHKVKAPLALSIKPA